MTLELATLRRTSGWTARRQIIPGESGGTSQAAPMEKGADQMLALQ
jgi:hypothetical protein